MINFLNKNKYFLLIILLSVIVVIATFEQNVGLIIDCGREAYYPQEILNGKVLYKDLFNIYSPFAYLFNAFLFKIFGINLKVLCIAGSLCAIGIVSTIFLLTKKILNEQIAFSISILTIAIGLVPTYLFNYIFPYAFAITYGLFAFLISLLFLVNYINSKNNIFLFISLFFAGLSVDCKYEFIPYLLVYLPVLYVLKPKFNTIFIGFLFLCMMPEMSFAYLFAKGLTFSDLHNTLNIIINMSHTQTLKFFYMNFGVFPNKETPIALITTFSALAVPFFVYLIPILFKEKIKNPVITIILSYLGICLMILFKNVTARDIYMALPLILLIASLINYKKIIKNLNVFVVIISIFLVSLKVFWGIFINFYGNYYLPIILIALAFLFKDKFTKKEWDSIASYVLILAVLTGLINFKMLFTKPIVVETPKGKIHVGKNYHTTTQLVEFIQNNTKKTDKIIILPEGMMINFLTDRKTDDFYNSFIPLYEETFGYTAFSKHFEKNMPEYIIFNSWDTSDYYFSMVCDDYNFDFCSFIEKNYKRKFKLSGGFTYTVYERK